MFLVKHDPEQMGDVQAQCIACGGHLAIEGRCLGCKILDACTYPKDGNGCWSWTGARRGNYGMMRLGRNKFRTVHRVAYAVWVAPLAPSFDVRHRCTDKACCRPDHLVLAREGERLGRFVEPYATNVRPGGARVWGEKIAA